MKKRGEEDAISGARHDLRAYAVREAHARTEALVRALDLPPRLAVAPGIAQQTSQRTDARHLNRKRRVEIEVGKSVVLFHARLIAFPTRAGVHGQLLEFYLVIHEQARVPVLDKQRGSCRVASTAESDQQRRQAVARADVRHLRIRPLRLREREAEIAGEVAGLVW